MGERKGGAGEEWERGEGEREKRREGRKEERSEEEGRRPIKETYSKCWLHTFLSPSYPALHPHTLIFKPPPHPPSHIGSPHPHTHTASTPHPLTHSPLYTISLAYVREPQLSEALGQVVGAGRLHTHSHSRGTVGVSKLHLPCVNEVPVGRDITAQMSQLAGWKRTRTCTDRAIQLLPLNNVYGL